MKIRNAERSDFAAITAIYERGRRFMRENGNPTQWGEAYPPDSLIAEDIRERRSYVLDDGGVIRGVFAFYTGVDPTYVVIEDGAWLNDEPYGVIHRIAGDGVRGGTVAAAVEFCLRTVGNIRIDTHENNAVMQHTLEKLGFVKCGRIYVADGTPRTAYHLDGTRK